METDLKTFLNSDLLEKYLIGDISTEELYKVEYFIDEYPEVKEQFSEMEDNLESFAKTFSRPAPAEVKQSVIDYASKEKKSTVPSTKWYYGAVACVVTLLFTAVSIYLWKQNEMLIAQNNEVVNKFMSLQNDIVDTNSKLEDFKNQLTVLNKAETRKYVIKGNQRAKDLKTVAYINSNDKLSVMNIVSLPELPEGQVFQMWANVDGELVSLGVLEKNEQQEKMVTLPFKENALSYNITIEPEGGNEYATIENEVANIAVH